MKGYMIVLKTVVAFEAFIVAGGYFWMISQVTPIFPQLCLFGMGLGVAVLGITVLFSS